jgi:SAM-dependent methyltransferase
MEGVNAGGRGMAEPMPFDFADYLEAKFALDERSLNPQVRQACLERIRHLRPLVRWLDVGTGTGAMVRRLYKEIAGSLSITALDRDAGLLDAARATLGIELERDGYRTLTSRRGIDAHTPEHRISIDTACCNLLDFEPRTAGHFDLITAHALMDVVPLEATLSRFAAWLAPGGLVYATLTYDGETTLYPVYDDQNFEGALLAAYDASMERRRVRGESTGGTHAGRRLHEALSRMGFDVIACGSSDWDITPVGGRYRDRDGDVLRVLLAFIRDEGERAAAIDPASLARWYVERSAAIDRAELGIIVHQLDMLAARRGA